MIAMETPRLRIGQKRAQKGHATATNQNRPRHLQPSHKRSFGKTSSKALIPDGRRPRALFHLGVLNEWRKAEAFKAWEKAHELANIAVGGFAVQAPFQR